MTDSEQEIARLKKELKQVKLELLSIRQKQGMGVLRFIRK